MLTAVGLVLVIAAGVGLGIVLKKILRELDGASK